MTISVLNQPISKDQKAVTAYINRKKAMTLAAHLLRNNPAIDRSKAFKLAWAFIKENNCTYIRFQTKKGITSRVVFENWADYVSVKGTGRPKPENLDLFVDCAKWILDSERPTISAYRNMIIEKI